MSVVRVLSTIGLFLTVILLPWWLYAVTALFALFLMPKYGEVIAISFFADLLYGVAPAHDAQLITIFTHSLFLTIPTVICFFIIEDVKQYLKFY